MTREQAIEKLQNLVDMNVRYSGAPEFIEALRVAIEALQRPKCYWCAYWNSETKGCKRNPSVQAWEEDDYCSYYVEIEELTKRGVGNS